MFGRTKGFLILSNLFLTIFLNKIFFPLFPPLSLLSLRGDGPAGRAGRPGGRPQRHRPRRALPQRRPGDAPGPGQGGRLRRGAATPHLLIFILILLLILIFKS